MSPLELGGVLLGSGIVGALIASRHDATLTGFLCGLLLGPLGIIVAIFADGRPLCPNCRERVAWKAKLCLHCRTRFGPDSKPVAVNRITAMMGVGIVVGLASLAFLLVTLLRANLSQGPSTAALLVGACGLFGGFALYWAGKVLRPEE